MSRLQPYTDDLGYVPGRGSADPVITDTVDSRADRFGLPHSVRAEIEAAIDREDASEPDENELAQRRYEMEQTITAVTKDKMLVELAHYAHALMHFAGHVTTLQKTKWGSQYAAIMAKGNHHTTMQFVVWFNAQPPGTDLDNALFRWARRHEWTPGITREEARNWKP